MCILINTKYYKINLYLPLLKMPYMKDVRCLQYSAIVLHILKIQVVSFLYEKKFIF